MAISSQLSAAATAFAFLAIVSTSLANAPLVFIWLALARKAESERNARRMRDVGVLGLQASPHGNLGREIIDRKGNMVRDRSKAM